jgi:Domain of unknown function (DUF4148)
MKSSPLDRREFLNGAGPLIVGAALLALSSGTFAQTAPDPGVHQVTRVEVRHELEELESVGYHQPVGNNPYYPGDIQAAEQRVEAKHLAQKSASMAGYMSLK